MVTTDPFNVVDTEVWTPEAELGIGIGGEDVVIEEVMTIVSVAPVVVQYSITDVLACWVVDVILDTTG